MEPVGMKVIFLGTNGWWDSETGNTPCVLIETSGQYIICDAGFGFRKVQEYITSKKEVHLFISHLHLDHIIGLHTLPIFKLPQGIDIHIPKRMLMQLRALLRRPFTSAPLLLSTKIRFHDSLAKGRNEVNFKTLRLRHSVPCYGYRFIADGRTVAYCTDTGICAGLKRLAAGVDLLITECAMNPGDRGPNLFHITPETAAKIAAESGAKRLALCHFDPGKYPTYDHRQAAERAAKSIFPNTVAATDDFTIDL